jgi:hypothetical protein
MRKRTKFPPILVFHFFPPCYRVSSSEFNWLCYAAMIFILSEMEMENRKKRENFNDNLICLVFAQIEYFK